MRLDKWFVRRTRYETEYALKVRLTTETEAEFYRLNSEIRRLFGVQDDQTAILARLTTEKEAAEAKVLELQAIIAEYLATEQSKRVSKETYASLVQSRCLHCGGAHSVACPRLKRIRFRSDGQTPLEVEYFEDFEWPKDVVIWIEDLVIDDNPS